MSKTQPFGADRCLNCGEYGAHFAPPSFGDEGFYICDKKLCEFYPSDGAVCDCNSDISGGECTWFYSLTCQWANERR